MGSVIQGSWSERSGWSPPTLPLVPMPNSRLFLNGHQKESGPEMLSLVLGSQSDPTRKAWAQSAEETELEG